MMTTQDFWGLQLEPSFVHTEKVTAPFMITMATLPERLISNGRTTVGIQINGIKYALCSLIPGKKEQQLMNLTLKAGEKLTFYIHGDNPIHLTGNYMCTTTSDENTIALVGERNEGSKNDEADYIEPCSDKTTQSHLKRSADMIIHSEPKKRKDDVKLPTAIEEPDIRRIQQLMDLLNKSATHLYSLTEQKQKQLLLPVEEEHEHYYEHQELGQQVDLRAELPPNQQPKEHSSRPEISPKQPKQVAETKSKGKDVTKRKTPAEAKKKSNEDIILEAKMKQDERFEARKRQEEKKMDKKMESKKQGPKGQEMKKPTVISEPASPSVSPVLSKHIVIKEETIQRRQAPVLDGFEVDDRKLGQGPRASIGDLVGLRFLVSLLNGTILKKNITGDLFKFTVGKGHVDRVWDLGVEGMKVGGERRVTIRPSLADLQEELYPGIPPNESINLDIKLEELQMAN